MNKLSQFVRRCEGCANPPRAENAEIAEPFKELDDHVSGRGETTCAVNACCGVGHHENESEECAPLPKPVFARIFASPSYRKEQEPFHQSAFYGPCIQRDSGAYSVSCREEVPNVYRMFGRCGVLAGKLAAYKTRVLGRVHGAP